MSHENCVCNSVRCELDKRHESKSELKIQLNQIKSKSNQVHAVSRTQQGRQREPSVKTLRSPLSAEFLEALRVE